MLATRNVVVTPGSYITQEAGNLRGHGTYVHEGALYANVAGMVQRVNRLISVQPISSRYVGEVGDVVVGRIVEVGAKRWTVDINARQHAILMLSSINLSGGVQRRRTTEDQLQMRSILSENDLISVCTHIMHSGFVDHSLVTCGLLWHCRQMSILTTEMVPLHSMHGP